MDRSWRSGRESPSALLRSGISTEELARAARLLMVRSRREATGLFSGNYASAFRGGGLEFEESRPYQPGDDVRSIDWNATARHRATYVKHFREERDQSLLFVLDASASMRAGHPLRSKAATAAHAVALLCAAAGRAGDRVGLVVFDDSVREVVPVARGVAHGWRVVQTAVDAAATPRGNTRLEAALRAVRIHGRRRTVAVVLSDFHESPGHDERRRRDAVWTLRQALGELSRRHDVVAAPVLDRLELALPRVGPVRVADPERPGRSWMLDTGSRRTRRRYLTACAERRRKLADSMRHSGADLLWLRTDQNPLHALRRFFHERAARRHRVGS